MYIHEGNKIHFGDSRYEDYTQHKNYYRMELYQKRHQHDRLRDPTSAGALSYFILWTRPDFRDGLINYLNHFNIKTTHSVEKEFNFEMFQSTSMCTKTTFIEAYEAGLLK